MKPVKTFLFSACALLFLLLMHFMAPMVGYEPLFRCRAPEINFDLSPIWSRPQHREWQAKRIWNDIKPENKELEEKEEAETQLLQKQWQHDSLMLFYKRVYRLEADIFDKPALQNIPITPFEYDSAQIGKELLHDFFARLLALRNPAQRERLDAMYEKTDFWDDPLARNRRSFIRILHYGDAQIENDHITGTLRRLMQADFGGSGPGLLPILRSSWGNFQFKKSGKWNVVKAEPDALRGNYGLYTAYLAPPALNAILQKSNDQGILRFNLPAEYRTEGLCAEAVVHADISEYNLQLSADNRKIPPAAVLEAFGLQRITYPLHQEKEISLQLKLLKNHNLYALALNDTLGVSVDNISMTGYAGDMFSANNSLFLNTQLYLLNTGLIIYQFGNPCLVAANSKTEDYGYYRFLLLKELNFIRIQMPKIPVIVVGMSGNSSLEPRPDMKRLKAIQRECAFQTGCVFWDLEEAMGGDDAMRHWAESQPALAARDGVHFTAKGADLAGKLLYKALLDAYRRFLLQQRKSLMMQRAKQLLSDVQTQ